MRISDWSSDVCSSDLRTESCTMATPSSRVVPRASVTWKSHDLPTMQAVVVPASTSALSVGSLSLFPSGLRVEPNATRSEERGVGKECVSTCRSRWAPYQKKKKKVQDYRMTMTN